jgi:hypothetical protein
MDDVTMADMVLQQIVGDIKASDAGCFTIKCDGTRDKNNVEKYVIGGALREGCCS